MAANTRGLSWLLLMLVLLKCSEASSDSSDPGFRLPVEVAPACDEDPAKRCNGKEECEDGADEEDCVPFTCHGPDMFECESLEQGLVG